MLNTEIPLNPIGNAYYQTARPMIGDITLEGDKIAIKSLKNWKTSGSDDISNTVKTNKCLKTGRKNFKKNISLFW